MAYTPLDLTRWCNAGPEDLTVEPSATSAFGLTGGAPIEVGDISLRGLPFFIPDSDRCLVAVDSEPVRITVGAPAAYAIFAHRLLHSDAVNGKGAGGPVAEYVFRLSDGTEVREPVRERFEIHVVPCNGFFDLPFRAVTDTVPGLAPRWEGNWGYAGMRQTEVGLLSPYAQRWWLWAWRNPTGAALESIELVGTGPRFVVGAITLSTENEAPFVREGRRPVRITLTDPGDAESPNDLSLDVDRGLSTYVHPLPKASPDEFIEDPVRRGFGEPFNGGSSPAYAEVSALPSATITVKQGDKELGAVKWGDVVTAGSAQTDRVRLELIDPGRNWVHVTVLDEETDQPVPCRVHFRSPAGVPYQPHGHHNHVNSNNPTWHIDVGGDLRLGQITYAYIDGTCQGWLPRGEVIVDVARGFEYEPLRKRVTIEPGQRELVLRIGRWTNMAEQGWWSGDSHVHFLSTQGSLREQRCEDLNVVNLLASQWGSLFTSTEEFIGGPVVWPDGRYVTYCTQENRQHFLGHITLLGLKRPIMPWCSDGASEAEFGGTLEVTMSDWADQTHEQGGTVVLPHFPGPNGEPSVLVATRRADAIEMLMQAPEFHDAYYRHLNNGYRLPLVGGTDKMSSDVPVGEYRAYAYIDGAFSYDAWCAAVTAGRTFLSGGPMIGMKVDGQEIGDTVTMSGPGTVEVEAWTESIFPIHTLQIVSAGRVVAEVSDPKGARRLELREKVRVDKHTWLAARCSGPGYFGGPAHIDRRGIFAHTSPVYVACGGEWWMFDPEVAQYMLAVAQGGLSYVREMATLSDPSMVTNHHGGDHAAYLERPFLEAIEQMQARIAAGR